ncbi:putative RTA1 domain protein, partial [Aureobasidium pullulans]
LYVYAPNKVAPVVFTVLFGISAVGHIWQCSHYRAWRMIGLHPMCAIFYTAGYALREYGAFNYLYSTTNLNIYIVSQVMIYICPPLLELANYHVLGRVLYYVPYCAPFPPNRIMSLFGALVAVVEALNGVGVAFTSNPSSTQSIQELGSKLTKASLAFQLAVIVVCVMLAGLFYRKCVEEGVRSRNVNVPLIILCSSMFLILVRCIYRLVEHLGNVGLAIDDLESMRQLTPSYATSGTSMSLSRPQRCSIPPSGTFGILVATCPDFTTCISRRMAQKSQWRNIQTQGYCSVLTFGIFFRQKKVDHGQSFALDSGNSRNSQA